MKLLYATSITLPSYRANRIQIVSMAKAWGKILGDNFILGIGSCEDKSLSGINFITTKNNAKSYFVAWRYLLYSQKNGITHIYCREEKMLFFMTVYNRLFLRLPIIFCYELHHLMYLKMWWHKLMLKEIPFIITITSAMKLVLMESGYPEERIYVAPDAVDLTIFNISIPKEEIRRKLSLPADKKIVIYTGDLSEPWKGVETLYEAAKAFDEPVLFLVVGSKPHHVEYFQSTHPNLLNFKLIGHKPHSEIPLYLKSADVAVLPNSSKSEISRISTSPMKLFEYMASGVPIVASDLPSTREILNEGNSILVEPDKPKSLADGIKLAIGDGKMSKKTLKAIQDVSLNTWDNRVKDITAFIKSK